MASAAQTITIDTANSPWVLYNGKKTTVSGQAQTFGWYMNDLGTTGSFQGAGAQSLQGVTLADGTKLQFSSDKKMVWLGNFTDTVAKANPGSLWVSEDDGVEHEVKVVTATIGDADSSGDENITTITFEYPGKPWRWTWTTIKTA
jgi:hypothetical protein